MNKSESVAELAKALVKAQADFGPLLKGAANPFFKSKYADLSSVMDVARGPLFENGLCFVQTNDDSDSGFIIVETTLLHSSGEWLSGRLKMPLVKNDPQGFGSAMTYARRYALQAILGLAAEDDDAESAMRRKASDERRTSHVAQKPDVDLTHPGEPSMEVYNAACEAFAKMKSETHWSNHWKKHKAEYQEDPMYDAIVVAWQKRGKELAGVKEEAFEDPDWVAPPDQPSAADKEFLEEAVESLNKCLTETALKDWAAQNKGRLDKSPFKAEIRDEYAEIKGRIGQTLA